MNYAHLTTCHSLGSNPFRAIWASLLVLVLAVPSLAKTTLDLQPGFDGRFRSGRWSPVFVEVKGDQPRSAILELHVPNASASAVTIRQAIGVGTEKQKYVLYAPLAVMFDPVRARLFDADTGKLLAEWPTLDDRNEDRGGEQIGFLAVTAGRSPVMQGFRRADAQGTTIISHQRPAVLPTTPIGYDAADLVFINDPEWGRFAPEQQNAIIAWVRAGGTLFIAPGTDPIPSDAPLAGILPCDVGEPTTQSLSAKQRQTLGLADRFASIAHRTLTPRPGAKEVTLPSNIAKAVVGHLGLGSIVVLPIEPSTLQFNAGDQFQKFWEGLIKATLGELPKTDAHSYYEDADIRAANAALDQIGDIPNTGSFGFGYIAFVIGGLMLVVGPIDWILLKKLGRQPWTWATTLGWIGIVTCCALYAGHVLRSGDLHFRTLRTIEQAGGRLVSMDDVALIYAPRSATYGITSDESEWWQPVPSGYRYRTDSIATPLRTEQTYKGNAPDTMWIDIWNWKFLRGTRYIDQAALVDAKLQVTGEKIRGQITNLGDKKLTAIELRHFNRWTKVAGEVEPGKTIEIDLPLGDPPVIELDANVVAPPFAGTGRDPRQFTQLEAIFGLSLARKAAVNRLETAGCITLYAKIDQPVTDIAITNPNAIVQQNVLLRAVFNTNP